MSFIANQWFGILYVSADIVKYSILISLILSISAKIKEMQKKE